ncbi:molybdate ABC transporter substrate-binding protein [Pseudooceanicola sp. C21-150M6]|uniref:molybdate ABC transporter substrate-binding protein n=1 Tax=Pseudooceanicola sp. C21-150M6 TaxID=3434355 RepID=UPI003D7F359E
MILLILSVLFGTCAPASAERVLVFAAASLAGPLDRAAEMWWRETGHEVVISYAGSSALARQIEQGAPADVFLSANTAWMDHLEAAGLLEDASRQDLWRNNLVLISAEAGPEIAIDRDLDLMGLLSGGRLSVALTGSVPAGIYARQALGYLGLWEAVEPMLAEADNVRAALALVATGAAPYGVVYATDAMAEPRVHLRGQFPDGSHDPIVYPGAVIKAGSATAADDFLEYLRTVDIVAIFREAGFGTGRDE